MKHYQVTWVIDVWADSPTEAAQAAQAIQRDPDSTATIFAVKRNIGGPVIETHTVDLFN